MPAYFDAYPNFAMRRDEQGILEFRVHSDGGPFRFTQRVHAQFVDAFYEIGKDKGNRVMIFTGTGDAWCGEYDRRPEVTPHAALDVCTRWDFHFWEGRKLMQNLLDIEVPVIGAVNGPAFIHSEYLLTCDILIASDKAAFQDQPHWSNGNAPTDGMHILWPHVLGPGRGRYFLMTQQIIAAEEALKLGVVQEIVPHDGLSDRAWELARRLALQPTLSLRYARLGLTQRLKKLMVDELALGLAVEGLAMAAKMTRPEGML